MQTNNAKSEIVNKIEQILTKMLWLEGDIEALATEVRDDFYEERLVLQADAQTAEDSDAFIRNRKPKRIFCNLHLSVRMLKGSLQIYWHTVYFHKVTKKKYYKYIPLNRTGVYDLRTLKSKCQPFEVELVKEAEAKAANVRLIWKKFIESRMAILRTMDISK